MLRGRMGDRGSTQVWKQAQVQEKSMGSTAAGASDQPSNRRPRVSRKSVAACSMQHTHRQHASDLQWPGLLLQGGNVAMYVCTVSKRTLEGGKADEVSKLACRLARLCRRSLGGLHNRSILDTP